MTESSPSGLPRFSIVSAVYDVARYLGDFIASIEAQDSRSTRVEVIMVNDGSPDSVRRTLADWRAPAPSSSPS